MWAEVDKTEWIKQVKDVVNHWHETDRLNQHQLTTLRMVAQRLQDDTLATDPNRRAKALRQVFKAAIDELGVEGEDQPPMSDARDQRWTNRRWRHYNLLTLSLSDLTPLEVAERMSMALSGHFYREQARAYEALAEVLRNQEGTPIDDASTAALSYPSGAVKLNDPYYIERDVDVKLVEALKRPGDTITIRGPRQVGKTSLLARGIYQSRRQFAARVAYFDLQEMDQSVLASLDAFLRSLAVTIFDELDLDLELIDPVWHSPLHAPRKLTKLLEKYVLLGEEPPLLLAMDEIDQLQFTGFGQEFFALVRSWHNRRATHSIWSRLTTIMAVSTEPYLLIDDLNQSPFNVGQTLNLEDFTQAQVADLNRRYGSPVGEKDLPRMIDLLGGHPYLTRVALYSMVGNNLTWDDLERKSASDDGPFSQHLQRLYRLITRDDRLGAAFREIVRTGQPFDEAAAFRLMKAGMVKNLSATDYDCRNQLYRHYFARII